MEDHKICDKCEINKLIDKYRKYTDKKNSYSKTCKKCLNEPDKIRKKNLRKRKIEILLAKCEKCEQEKALQDFVKLKKFYKKKICISCYPMFLTEQKTECGRNESKSNINYRLKKSLAARLRSVLNKTNSTMNYIGCNIQYLREWIEYNFTPEMNWDNYCLYWLIDHIIPVCKFDLTKEDEKLQCWNWTNLIPVTLKINSSPKKPTSEKEEVVERTMIPLDQIDNIIKKIEKFKEEGSTTKWFSREFILNLELINLKINN
jgi:hypothetical protein